jgi:hypothetical protein
MAAVLTGPIRSWSFSRWDTARRCARRIKLSVIDKIKEPEQPNSPASRGDQIHKSIELITTGQKKVETLHIAAKPFKAEIIKLSEFMARKAGEAEQMWCYDKEWVKVDPKDFDRTWLRVKLDQLVWLSKTKAVLIDYKSGKRAGNEIKHNEQTQLYALASFLRFPQLQELWVELWYVDKDILHKVHYTRDQALRHYKTWNERGIFVTSLRQFEPQPSTYNCSYCPYKTGWMGKSGVMGTGHCDRNP